MADSSQLNRIIQDAWHRVPEGERTQLKTFAQSKGAETCAVAVACAAVVSFAFGQPLLFFASLACAPLLFQVVTVKFWRTLRPQLSLQYYVASSTATTYAQALKAEDTSLKLIFRGSLAPDQKPTHNGEEDAGAAPAHDVWVALFPDLLLMISEGESGATIAFAQAMGADLKLSMEDVEDAPKPGRRLFIHVTNAHEEQHRWILTSPHPTTLLACERKVRACNEKAIQRAAEREAAERESALLESISYPAIPEPRNAIPGMEDTLSSPAP